MSCDIAGSSSAGSGHRLCSPDRLEIEAGHRQRQVGREVVRTGHPRQRTALHDTLGQPSVAGSIERLVVHPKVEPLSLTGRERLKEIVNVEWQE